jgi:hypothetical protein
VAGDEPESRISKPRIGERQESGPFGEGKLILQVQPGRVDWIYATDQDAKEGDQQELSFPPSLDLFSAAMADWLKSCSAMPRMAFGAVLRLPVSSREEGYRRISEYLPFEVDPETSSDFLYQINRQRESRVIPGVKINRLSKWSVGFVFRQMIQLTVPDREPNLYPLDEGQYCRIELDINTVPGPSSELPKDRLADVFGELVELGREIVREGDQS